MARVDPTLNKLCSKGHLKAVQEVVEKLNHGVLENLLTQRSGSFGYTPIHAAVVSGRHEVLAYLLSKARYGSEAVNVATSSSGYTPLHLAASSGSVECVKVFLEHGANITIPDKLGKTPKQIAELNNKLRIMRILENEGINYVITTIVHVNKVEQRYS